jgi:hypothetical protein
LKNIENNRNQCKDQYDDYDIMDGLTDDERELGRSFWEGIY